VEKNKKHPKTRTWAFIEKIYKTAHET